MLSVEDSYAWCRKLTKRRATNFYYAFWFLPAERRRSLFAVYAFSRRADDAADGVDERGLSRAGAHAEIDRLRDLLDLRPSEDPLHPALKDTIERYAIPREPFEELLRGMEMDLDGTDYRTFDDLHLYCYRAASVVGLISIEVFGKSSEAARAPAIDLGIAMQLTNILRDLKEDVVGRGRCYLPAEDLERFGCTAGDLARGVVDDRLRGLLRFEAARAREHFERAEALFPMILPESRYCPILLKRFYSRILDRIERAGYDVFARRPRLPLSEKLRLAAGLWLETRGWVTSRTRSRSLEAASR